MTEVGRRFGSSWVLSHLSLQIRRGESIALFGRNGSGKSTLLKLVATLLSPTIGELNILGWDVLQDKQEIRKGLRLLGHEKQLYGMLTVLENLQFAAATRGLALREKDLCDVLDRLGIAHKKDQRVSELSEGTKKRLVLARLLLGEPELILLDEPHPTLDLESRDILHSLISDWRKQGKTILLASHDHEQTLAHVDRLLLLEEGQILYDGKPVGSKKIEAFMFRREQSL